MKFGSMIKDVLSSLFKRPATEKYPAERRPAPPRLRGKLHIVCGAEDTFHLEEAATLLCDFLRSKGREESCEIVPGRDHNDLFEPYRTYPEGLMQRIDDEMRRAFEAHAR